MSYPPLAEYILLQAVKIGGYLFSVRIFLTSPGPLV
jgi:hypothetical protein